MPWTRRARKREWQPRLTLERTGYSGERWQWCLYFDQSSCGGPILGTENGRTPAEAWAYFRAFLVRIGSVPIEGPALRRRFCPQNNRRIG